MRVTRAIRGRTVRAVATAVTAGLTVLGAAACEPAPVPPRPPRPPVTTTTTTTTTTPATPAPTELEVTYRANGSEGGSLVYTVRCGPGAAASITPVVAGLDAQHACATVAARRTLIVDGPPRDEFCLFRIYGPQTARVRGHVDDAPVDRWFGRNDSCGDRAYWQVAGLFPPSRP